MFRSDRRTVGYTTVYRALTPELARAHIHGNVTLGTSLVRADDTVTSIVYDLDATRAALDAAEGDVHRTRSLHALLASEGLRMLRQLRLRGLDPLLVDSGHKGRHLWVLLDKEQPTPALPVGLHLRSGRRAAILDDEGRPLADPFARLRELRAGPLPTGLPEAGAARRRTTPAPPAAPPAPPVADGPAWTEADFDADGEVSTVLAGCAVLRTLIE